MRLCYAFKDRELNPPKLLPKRLLPRSGTASPAGLSLRPNRQDRSYSTGSKPMDRFPDREDDSWFSDAQLGAVARADDGDNLRSPIPTAMVSNGEAALERRAALSRLYRAVAA